jgi:hypothetical protein
MGLRAIRLHLLGLVVKFVSSSHFSHKPLYFLFTFKPQAFKIQPFFFKFLKF